MAARVQIRVLALDLPATIRLLRSAAIAKAMADTTSLEWVRDSTPLDFLYTIAFWKGKPGHVELKTGRREDVLKRAEAETSRYCQSLLRHSKHGTAALAGFLAAAEQSRTYSLETIRGQVADAQAINREIVEMTGHFLKDLARVKFASDVILAIPGGAPLVLAMSYGVITTFIKEASQASSGNVILFKVGKSASKDGIQELAKQGSELAAEETKGYRMALHNAEVDIRRESFLLKRRSVTERSALKATRRLEEASVGARAAQSGARLATGARWALKGMEWAFVAVTVKEAWAEYCETVESSGSH